MIVTAGQVKWHTLFSLFVTVGLTAIATTTGYFYSPSPVLFWCILLPGFAWGACVLFQKVTHRYRQRLRVQNEPFPDAWREILQTRVAFYLALSPDEQMRFETMIQIFLAETPVIGSRCDVDDMTRVLVGASAIIPVFGFPAWEYDTLAEVIVTPGAFDATMNDNDGMELNALGMVGGAGMFSGTMILSKPDLLRGFFIHGDKQNVGIHEFAHLIDKATGSIDGVPVSLPSDCFRPWARLVREELERKYRGRPDIDEYGLTSEEEFFAVVSEYFFEAPGEMKKKHPELYDLLQKIFRQNTDERFGALFRRLWRRKRVRARGIGRNDPCPCGSGKKYKKCCGRGR